MRYIGFIAVLAFLVASCGNKKSTSETQMPETTASKAGGETSLIIDQSGNFDEGDAYNVTSAEIKGDSLRVTITHGGGCKDHVYKLYSNGAMMKSLPPKMNLVLYHNGNEDYCRALIQKNLSFNISELKSMAGGRIILNLSNFDQPLEYNY